MPGEEWLTCPACGRPIVGATASPDASGSGLVLHRECVTAHAARMPRSSARVRLYAEDPPGPLAAD